MANYSSVAAMKAKMAELKDLMKDIAALDTEIASAGPHKRIQLCQERMGKTSRMESLIEHIQCKIDAMDVLCQKTMNRRLREITEDMGYKMNVNNVNTKTATARTKHGNEASVSWKTI
jgi:chorismate mutase